MNILVISNNYPSKVSPNYGAFVYNLMQELGKTHNITIISPNKLNNILKKKGNSYGEEICSVLRPLYFSFSNRKFWKINTGRFTAFSYRNAVNREVRKLTKKPDIVYTHFLSNAIAILDYVVQEKIPLVIASGESTYDSWLQNSVKERNRLINKVSYIICVSKENSLQLKEFGFDGNKLSVIPNAVNYSLFRPLDKDQCRAKLGLPRNKFTVGFIGHFIHRKGPNRIIEAIKTLDDDDIQLVCVGGKGDLMSNDFTIELSPVPNYQLPCIYNSFDVFVLPTLQEGHCNVIEEAKACGIPIISSKGTSVEEQIDGTVGILVDPMNIEEIAEAIYHLKNNKDKLLEMRLNLENRRSENSIEERAAKISSVLRNVLGKFP